MYYIHIYIDICMYPGAYAGATGARRGAAADYICICITYTYI